MKDIKDSMRDDEMSQLGDLELMDHVTLNSSVTIMTNKTFLLEIKYRTEPLTFYA